ncbi:MAG: hypothetical protein RBS05_15555 [Zoogloea oleivorans]|jgi:hypothetical protein|uniref:hypothetical protein n=1 Tax=Zoogloea oleivorans TaxID=1552750 RepID=UPI002A369A02|nr:hypothetical protein [Zoogloea oleivorans]MDY0037325.1 hypothetical protein [Zoogloea oleivorans]
MSPPGSDTQLDRLLAELKRCGLSWGAPPPEETPAVVVPRAQPQAGVALTAINTILRRPCSHDELEAIRDFVRALTPPQEL